MEHKQSKGKSMRTMANNHYQQCTKVPFFFSSVLGLELRAYTLRHSTSPFSVMGIFKIGFQELFAGAGFEP
jgi:hypothetical protein